MLKEERLGKIIDLVNKRRTVKTKEIADALGISLATVRRDLNELDSLNKIHKIFGGASSIKNAHYITTEDDMTSKATLNVEEKVFIGKYGASLIKDNDFVYLDSGTSVEAMIPYIKANNLKFVTNSITCAKKLALINQNVFILPGNLKGPTESLLGPATTDSLDNFNFTLGFFGTNGIHKDTGFSTPDINEAMVKRKALSKCKKAFVLADSSKFGLVSQVSFSKDPKLKIITCKKDKDYFDILIKTYKED
ncbi:MAG: DeoR/GlpR family DNA-binding transcription regulator [Anaerococcus sp.]|nr:DeoR/GlpR family DNA-binding transcription regulator [Anaerococcus sp.]